MCFIELICFALGVHAITEFLCLHDGCQIFSIFVVIVLWIAFGVYYHRTQRHAVYNYSDNSQCEQGA